MVFNRFRSNQVSAVASTVVNKLNHKLLPSCKIYAQTGERFNKEQGSKVVQVIMQHSVQFSCFLNPPRHCDTFSSAAGLKFPVLALDHSETMHIAPITANL